MSSSQPSHVIYEKEEKIKIDYSGLEESLQDLEDDDEVRQVEKRLEKQINEVSSNIQRIQVKTYYFYLSESICRKVSIGQVIGFNPTHNFFN